MVKYNMKGGFIGNLSKPLSITIIVLIIVVVLVVIIVPIAVTQSRKNTSSDEKPPANYNPGLDFSLTGNPTGCANILGCVNTNVTLTVTPSNIQLVRNGTINWTLLAYSQGGGVYNNDGSIPVSSLGNNTVFSIQLGNGNAQITSAQVKVSITKGSITSMPQYYNYTV